MTSVDPASQQRIQDWATKLVDLSRRNRLLFYRATKRTTLTFRHPDPDAIFRGIIAGRSFECYRPPDLPPLIPGRPRDATPLDDELRRRPPKDRELVTTQRDPAEIDKSLEAISRKAHAEYEDRGTHVLYLAWNLLRWTDARTGEEQRAPLVVTPLDVSRVAFDQSYKLQAPEDGEALVNPALRVKLQADFGVTLPDLDVDEMEPADVLSELRSSVPSGFVIEPHAAVGIFGFAKEAMYRDLVDHAETVARHHIIRSLIAKQLTEEVGAPAPATNERQASAVSSPSYSVIDADSTQMQAIEAANRGQSFVLEGPPGTGKSQTISNIIAEAIGRGKSVLFVSEKMAALEVVAKRLQASELGGLVLELHSAKASRREVAQALSKALDGHPEANAAAADGTYRTVVTNGALLDGYVDALHERRTPLGRSAFDVLAELATLSSVPAIESPGVDAQTATEDALVAVQRMGERLQDAWLPVEDGAEFPWLGMEATGASAALRERVSGALFQARESVAALERLDLQIARGLDLRPARSQDERRARGAIGDAIALRTSVPVEWLTSDDITPYTQLLATWAERSEQHARLVGTLEDTFGPQWRAIDPGTHAVLEAGLGRVVSLLRLAEHWDAGQVLERAPAATDAARRLPQELAEVANIMGGLCGSLGVSAGVSRDAAVRVIEVGRLSQSHHRPPRAWLGRARLEEARSFLAAYGPKYLDWQQGTAALRTSYEPALLDLELDGLIDRMGRWHGHWWSRLRPQYRQARAAIRTVTKGGVVPPTVLDDLAVARRAREIRSELGGVERQARHALGPYAKALATDVSGAGAAVDAAQRLLDLEGVAIDWDKLGDVVTAEAPYRPEVERQADHLRRAVDAVGATLAAICALTPPGSRDAMLAWEHVATEAWATALVVELERLIGIRDGVAAIGDVTSVAGLLEVARSRAETDRLETGLEADEPVLRAALRSHFEGFATDWATLLRGVEWAAEMRSAYGAGLPERVAQDLLSGGLDGLPWQEHANATAALDGASGQVQGLSPGNWGVRARDAITGPADDAKSWLDTRLTRIEDLEVWQAHLAAKAELERSGWTTFVEVATSRRLARADLVPALRRAWLDGWFASLAVSEPVLGAFSRTAHERAVEAFRAGDSQMVQLGRELVLREYGRRLPPPATIQGGEQAVVRREALKRRRHVPVRTLLGSIPTLLPKLKPCLMMSPLSVSHFLTPETTFDLVVFDEASQVPPEDAVNCIYRGRQLIVAGDSRQLPPTSFFRLMAQSEDDGEELEDDIDDFESVLDLCKATGFAPYPLLWHYRSRHDALIAFSNRHIYDGRLITFPAPYTHSPELGVQFEYVPNASFDRGRSATNQAEARRVVELVVRHWERNLGESIGVVAFSVAQQEAVQDAIARAVEQRPDLQRHLASDRLDGFFVKNLETVQGDERDVIVFTIGYGPDTNGRIYRNFGALNRPGGDRRLNVAVTRARRRVVVVSSMRATDLDKAGGTLTRGPRLLRDYLEYAERGVLPEVVHGHDAGPGPLEHDVADVVRSLGWEVAEQVGTSRYRIDLGVVSKVQPGRLVLGVECDGQMYRGASNTRDRDRLRPSVLRDLGWTTHRVWAPDWYQHRQSEIRRLADAIDAAERASAMGPTGHREPPPTIPPAPARPTIEVAEVHVAGPDDAVRLGWAVHYRVADVPAYRTWREFHEPELRIEHAKRVADLVAAEGPVHQKTVTRRLTEAFGVARAGNRIQEAVLAAIIRAEGPKGVRRRGAFVWPATGDLTQVRVPIPGREETTRTIDLIPPEELELALLRMAEMAGSIERDQLLVAVARTFGYDRTGGKIDSMLSVRVDNLVGSGRLALVGTIMSLGGSANLPSLGSITLEADGTLGGWFRHPRRGVGRLLKVEGSVWTLDFKGDQVRFDSEQVNLTPVPGPS